MQRKWTEAEIDYLENNYGSISIKKLMKRLNRTRLAITTKAYKLNLGTSTAPQENFTFQQVCQALNISHVKLNRWIRNGLKMSCRLLSSKRKTYSIQPNRLLKWLKEHPEEWDATKVENYALGQEPEWLRQKRWKDKKIPKKKFTTWTIEEELQAIELKKIGCSNSEIALRLERSEQAVKNKISRLTKGKKIKKLVG